MIDLYYWPTPNGHKVTLLLEEAGLEYAVKPVDIGAGDQFKPEFLEISPNNKMPAIVDHEPVHGGGPQSVFESGAILLYLAEKTGKFLPEEPRARIEVLEWLFWQVAGQGPMSGQYGHFNVYAPEKIQYAIDRYTKEVQRLMKVLDTRLGGREFIAGDGYSIADMAVFPWINAYDSAPIDMAPYPNVVRWHEAIAARPATAKAYALGKQVNPDLGKPMTEEQKKNLFGR
ncbi:glutathione binding-like protein [Luteimonas sp. JM171]|uniref:glutathione binding-like protein n=1 Tax=Luteimonas sp. JM171 TaxID=1896164 RepID=UPI0008558DCF|nr:glutathione S-transferase C-terminal domain-containing protein [Luteimonas sp. JM171]AOH35988.1 thiol:disulfide oxidoreductase [Luteimonas sp. JM171]